jgi:hypothetical protein
LPVKVAANAAAQKIIGYEFGAGRQRVLRQFRYDEVERAGFVTHPVYPVVRS